MTIYAKYGESVILWVFAMVHSNLYAKYAEPTQVWIYSVLAGMFHVNLGQGLGVQRAQS